MEKRGFFASRKVLVFVDFKKFCCICRIRSSGRRQQWQAKSPVQQCPDILAALCITRATQDSADQMVPVAKGGEDQAIAGSIGMTRLNADHALIGREQRIGSFPDMGTMLRGR